MYICTSELIICIFFRHLKGTVSLLEIIESNRLGIKIIDLVGEEFDTKKSTQKDYIEKHECGTENITRFVTLTTSPYGCTIFFLNRYAFENEYIHQIIRPNDSMVIGENYLQLTTMLFFANGHCAAGVNVDTKKRSTFVIYDDLKPECVVSNQLSLDKFYNIN